MAYLSTPHKCSYQLVFVRGRGGQTEQSDQTIDHHSTLPLDKQVSSISFESILSYIDVSQDHAALVTLTERLSSRLPKVVAASDTESKEALRRALRHLNDALTRDDHQYPLKDGTTTPVSLSLGDGRHPVEATDDINIDLGYDEPLDNPHSQGNMSEFDCPTPPRSDRQSHSYSVFGDWQDLSPHRANNRVENHRSPSPDQDANPRPPRLLMEVSKAEKVRNTRSIWAWEDMEMQGFYQILGTFFDHFFLNSQVLGERSRAKNDFREKLSRLVIAGNHLVKRLHWNRQSLKGRECGKGLFWCLPIHYFHDVISKLLPRQLSVSTAQLEQWHVFYDNRHTEKDLTARKAYWSKHCRIWWKGKPYPADRSEKENRNAGGKEKRVRRRIDSDDED